MPTPQPDAVSSAASYLSLYVARTSLAVFRSRLAHCAGNFYIRAARRFTKRRDCPNPTCALKIEKKGHHRTLSRRLELPLTALRTAWTVRVSFFKLKFFKESSLCLPPGSTQWVQAAKKEALQSNSKVDGLLVCGSGGLVYTKVSFAKRNPRPSSN